MVALGQCVPAGLKRDKPQWDLGRSEQVATEPASHECGSLEKSGQSLRHRRKDRRHCYILSGEPQQSATSMEQHDSKEMCISGRRIKTPSLLGLPGAGRSHYQFDSQRTSVCILLTPWRPQTPPQWSPGTPRGSLRLWKAKHSRHNAIE